MNTVKLYRLNRANEVEVMRIKCTQSTEFYARYKRKRTLPYAWEVWAWGAKNGWSDKKNGTMRGALTTKPSKVALSVRRAVLDRRPVRVV